MGCTPGLDYADYRWTTGEHTAVLSAATLYPCVRVPGQLLPRPRKLALVVRASLLAPGALLATSTLDTGQQWDAPNGWAPLQWIATGGLRESGGSALWLQRSRVGGWST